MAGEVEQNAPKVGGRWGSALTPVGFPLRRSLRLPGQALPAGAASVPESSSFSLPNAPPKLPCV